MDIIPNTITEIISSQEGFLIDSHCHLQYFPKNEIAEIVDICQKKNILHLLTNATHVQDFDATIEIAKDYPSKVIPGVGYHPWYLDYPCEKDTWFDEYVSVIENLDACKMNYFIGEIGIDGGKVKKKFPLVKQIEIFEKQVEYANHINKLVSIHCVYEWDKLFKSLNKINSKEKLTNLIKDRILLHSFQGSKKIAQAFSQLNVWYSLSPGCFHESNFEMIKSLPIERMLLESDAPSMFNDKIYRSEDEMSFYYKEDDNVRYKNHPACVIPLLKSIAELKQIEESELLEQITKNNKKLISIFSL